MTEMMINGEAFNVVVEGEANAPVLMLAHPLGGNLHLFDRLMPELLRHFRVVRYDSRGHGSSVVTQGPYSLAQLGQDALAILDALGIEKAHWLGVSKGGMVGLWLLIHAPERIGRAVPANVTAHFGSTDMWNERIRNVHEKGLENLVPSVLENWFTKSFREHHPEEVERIWEILLSTPVEGYAGASAALRDMDQREAIRSISNPVLVIIGRHDPVTTPGLGALVASAIPGAKLVTLETAHMSCVEDPEGFNQAAIEFLTTEAPMNEEEPEHKTTAEITQPVPPPKKPRKPKEPHKEPEPGSEGHIEGASAAAGAPGEFEAGSGAEISVPAPVERKPRRAPAKPRKKVAAPAIAVAAPQPRKRPAKKAAAKKAAAKKAPAKKAAAKKSAARKAVGKKTAVKKSATARKSVAKKTVARKSAAKKAAAKKAPIRKIAAKKAAVRKAVVKKTVAKKAGAKKPTKKTATRKPLPRHLPGRRPTRKR
jgi:3-oxoadipate enol-lactonase